MQPTSTELFPATVLARLAELGEAVLFEFRDREVSAREVLDLVDRIATVLRSTGAGPGSAVALMTGVSPQAFAANLAAHLVGATVCGVRPGLTAHQLGELFEPWIGFALVDPSAPAADLARLRPDLVMVDVDAPLPAGDGDLIPNGHPDDIARVTYTSGSTAAPKGCGQTYAAMSLDWPWRPEFHSPGQRDLGSRLERYLLHTTLSSPVMLDYAFLSMFRAAEGRGGRLVVPAEPAPFAELVRRHRITGSIITPPGLLTVLAQVRAGTADLGGLRGLFVGGSPLDPRRYAEALERLGPIVFHGYGQSETGLISMLSPTEALSSPSALASVGQPLPHARVRVREGELQVRLPKQTVGYVSGVDRAEETVHLADGWIRTRDLGYLDEQGRLHLTGRARDVVIVNATVYTAGSIERAICAHPLVDSAYVVGEPDEHSGESIHAFVILRGMPGPDLTADLAATVARQLGRGCVPRSFTVIDRPPLTPGGKPDKRALRRRG